ncbi:Uncharacterised protein [Serratia grimesii]|uniref:hypothetical protein n=1 Tax=Serratia grimesii TaxID=82995 RepID=UPI00217B994E|nr:hypothetical protein [Serratia grimesii]CAI1834804.1 Uncharacterised protein [Serratia grimesii]
MRKETLVDDDRFITHMLSELEHQLTESQTETDVRWQGSEKQSPSITWGEFAGNFS